MNFISASIFLSLAIVFAVPNSNMLDNPKTDTMVFLASDLPLDFKNSIKPEIGKLLTESEPEDVIHFVETPSQKTIASIRIPNSKGKARLRKPEVRLGMQRLGKFLKRRPERMEGVLDGQLEVPAIGSTIQSLRRNSGKVSIVLIGNPVYDNKGNAVWSMKNGRVPSDASINSKICPFGCTSELPEGSEVKWLIQSASWGKSEKHRRAVIRFYQLYFQKYDSKLTRVSTEPVVAFGKPSADDDSLDLSPAVSDGDDFVGMKELVARPVPVEVRSKTLVQQDRQEPEEQPETAVVPDAADPRQKATTEEPSRSIEQAASALKQQAATQPSLQTKKEVEKLIDTFAANPLKTFVAINWVSPDSRTNCDIDLWISNRATSEEIYFRRKDASFGKLYRDIRVSGSLAGNPEEFRSWECAEIFHDRITELDIWLNAYETDRPVQVRVIVVWKGIRSEKVLRLNTSRGDGAKNRLRRDRHSAWLKVDVPF